MYRWKYPEHKSILRENFIKFVPVKNSTGKHLANVILETINSLGINPKYIIGQQYDNRAAAINGNFNGIQVIIRKVAALYVHRNGHSLNLALSLIRVVFNIFATVFVP